MRCKRSVVVLEAEILKRPPVSDSEVKLQCSDRVKVFDILSYLRKSWQMSLYPRRVYRVPYIITN